MGWGLLDWVTRLGTTDRSETVDSDVRPDGSVETNLYTCGDCETTYISEEMGSCTGCDELVTQVPTGADLGFDSPDGGVNSP